MRQSSRCINDEDPIANANLNLNLVNTMEVDTPVPLVACARFNFSAYLRDSLDIDEHALKSSTDLAATRVNAHSLHVKQVYIFVYLINLLYMLWGH